MSCNARRESTCATVVAAAIVRRRRDAAVRTRLALTLLALTVAPVLAGEVPPSPGRVVFSTLTFAAAQRLEGCRGRYQSSG